jgi:hypothetical protein
VSASFVVRASRRLPPESGECNGEGIDAGESCPVPGVAGPALVDDFGRIRRVVGSSNFCSVK